MSRRSTVARSLNRSAPPADRDCVEHAARALLTSEGWQRWVKVGATKGLSRYTLLIRWLIASVEAAVVSIDGTCHRRGSRRLSLRVRER